MITIRARAGTQPRSIAAILAMRLCGAFKPSQQQRPPTQAGMFAGSLVTRDLL